MTLIPRHSLKASLIVFDVFVLILFFICRGGSNTTLKMEGRICQTRLKWIELNSSTLYLK